MFRNILFAMSLSGSVVVLLYLFFYPLAKRYFPLVWRYRVLKIAVFFYLVPVSRWKYRIFDLGRTLFPELWDKIYTGPGFRSTYSIVMGNGWIRWSSGVYGVVFLIMTCVIISILIYSGSILKDRRVRRAYLAGSEEAGSQKLSHIFRQIQKELHIKRRVRIQCSEYCSSPVTCGLLFPVVYFPDYGDNRPGDSSLRYMVKHELLHIKHHDLLMRYLGFLVLAVHWFNPLSYFLVHELSDIGEMCCDNGVLDGEGENGRKQYGELLLQAAVCKAPGTEASFFVGLAGRRQQKIIKRRIIEMKRNRKQKIIFSILVMILISMAGGMTAFAYTPFQTVSDMRNDSIDGCWMVNDGVMPDAWYLDEDEKPEMILWDDYFIDSAGNAAEITDEDFLGRAICKHDYSISGTYYNHVKNSQGGCTVTEYEAKRCSMCGSVQKGDVTNVVTYQKCPH